MICVTPYVVEARSVTSKTGFMHTELLKSGIGIVMQPCERLLWRGVRNMAFRTRHSTSLMPSPSLSLDAVMCIVRGVLFPGVSVLLSTSLTETFHGC